MLSPAEGLVGGVIDVVRMLCGNFSSDVSVEIHTVGSRPEERSRISAVWRAFADVLGLLDATRRRRVELVHLNPSLNGAAVRDGLAMLALGLVGFKRTLVFFHGWEPRWESWIDASKLWQWFMLTAFGSAGHILVLSARFRDRLLDWGFDPNRVSVVSTMFDETMFVGIRRLRTDEGIQLLFLSRFVESKGMYVAMEAFSRLLPEYPGMRLVMAGDGPELGRMRAWVRESRLEGKVVFAGFVRGHEKAQLLMDSDIYLFPSRFGEGCPVSLLEAMAAGLAVVTSSVGGIPDIFEDGRNGRMLSSLYPDELVAALRSLLADRAERMAIGRRNRETAIARFSASAVAARIESYYSRICSR